VFLLQLFHTKMKRKRPSTFLVVLVLVVAVVRHLPACSALLAQNSLPYGASWDERRAACQRALADLGAQSSSNEQWVDQLCSHVFVHVRGLWHGGTGVVRLVLREASGLPASIHTSTGGVEDEAGFLTKVRGASDPSNRPGNKRRGYCPKRWNTRIGWGFCYPPRDEYYTLREIKQLWDDFSKFWDTSASVLIEKVPLPYAEYEDAFPHVSFTVFVIRHPLSMVYQSAGGKKVRITPYVIMTWLLEWIHAMQVYLRDPPPGLIVVRFEDFLLHQDEVACAAYKHMGLGLPCARPSNGRSRQLHLRESGKLNADRVWRGNEISYLQTCQRDSTCNAFLKEIEPYMRSMWGYSVLDPLSYEKENFSGVMIQGVEGGDFDWVT
jgi:hypothetical protein